MKISILTLFPKMFEPLNESILGRATKKGALELNVLDIRDFSLDKHKKCDDYPFGGGSGMVMTPQPIYDAIQFADPQHKALRIYLSPKGRVLNQDLARELAAQPNLLLLCGHYEGVDQRVLDSQIDCEISVGDYVLTGGEPAAIVLVDCVSRLVDGVLGNELSASEESFSSNLLEYPQYTRPQEFMGMSVPEVLLSGHHANILKWRHKKALELTKELRADLYEKYEDNE